MAQEELEVNDEEIKQAFDLGEAETAEALEEVIEPAEIVEEAVTLSPAEIEARDMGHTSKAEWEAQGKDPEDWVSPREYVRYGKLQKSMHDKLASQKRETDQRLDNLNQYHEAQRQIEVDKLKSQQRAAVESADTEEYDRIQGQLDKAEAQAVPDPTPVAEAGKPADMVAWEKANPWVYDNGDSRTIIANARYGEYMANNQGAQVSDGLAHVDRELAKTFPKQNMRRETAQPTTETSTRTNNRAPKELTMNDLTHEERQFWGQAGGSMFNGDQKSFLATVADARKEG